MMRAGSIAALGLITLLLGAASAGAQETAAPEAAPQTEGPAPAPDRARPKPKSKPRPKPKPAPEAKPAPAEPGGVSQPGAASQPAEAAAPVPADRTPAADAASRPDGAAPNTFQTAFTPPPVVCDPGKSVRYEGEKEVALWVTRAGLVTIENPLRPLTPDVTRVLQLVIGDKLATAYGPDLTALRRGGSPPVLEAALGGPIRWDATLGALPDTLTIVADSGKTLAEPRFKECGDAPAVRQAPVARGKTRPAAPKSARTTPMPAAAEPRAAAGGTAPPRRQFQLPQGAIAE